MANKIEQKKEQKGGNTGAVIGGILGVAAAATAGAYFLYGTKKGKQVHKQIKGWTLKAKAEILEKMEMLKDVNEEAYHQVVDKVLKRYESLKHIDSREVVAISKELKDHWKNIQKELEHGAKKVSKMKDAVVKKAGEATRAVSTPATMKKSRPTKAKKASESAK